MHKLGNLLIVLFSMKRKGAKMKSSYQVVTIKVVFPEFCVLFVIIAMV